SVWVVFNGEIYNHHELRSVLEARRHRFQSESDTETLIHGYEEWGISGLVDRVRGMFAFGLWDVHAKALHLVRDRLGVKPLWFARVGSHVVFSSEVAPLYQWVPASTGTVKPDSLDFYLAFGHLPASDALVRGIEKVPPATILTFSATHERRSQYWQL